MSRPSVSIVMPFAGDRAAAEAAMAALRSVRIAAGDELILADNAGTASSLDALVHVVPASRERSPAHARNAGAERARGDWILFLDADCVPPADLLERYFSAPVADDVGALAGEVHPVPGTTVAERYGVARSFLSQRAHLAHPYRPRAVAANLLVRRAAFTDLGGFLEGLRAAEDTDFTWRLQAAGWRLELRAEAAVAHHYRSAVGELRRQWRGYAAGRAWLARRYPGFTPEPALWRALRRARGLLRGGRPAPRPAVSPPSRPSASRGDRARFRVLDGLLAVEELGGLALSNRPVGAAARRSVEVVLVADRFPATGDPLVELACSLGAARVEAAARPVHLDRSAWRALDVAYREDDGVATRLRATAALATRHPLRCLADVRVRPPGAPTLVALAPAAWRLGRDRTARLLAIGPASTHALAGRLAALAGRSLDEPLGPS